MTAFWQGKQIFVTGADGFIGNPLVEWFHAEGARVRGFVRYNSRGEGNQVQVHRDVTGLSQEKSDTSLGWSPRFSLNEGLARTIEWIRSHLDMVR